MAKMSRMSRRTKRSVNKSRRSSRRVRRHRGGGDTALQLVLTQPVVPTGRPPAAPAARKAFNAAAAAAKAAVGNVNLDAGFTMPADYKVNGVQKQAFTFSLPAGKKMTKLTAMKSGGTAPIDIPIGTSRAAGTSMSATVDGAGIVNIYNVNSSNLGILGGENGKFTLTVTTDP